MGLNGGPSLLEIKEDLGDLLGLNLSTCGRKPGPQFLNRWSSHDSLQREPFITSPRLHGTTGHRGNQALFLIKSLLITISFLPFSGEQWIPRGDQGFPGDSVVKNPPANVGDIIRHRFDPRAGKIPWRRKWKPTPIFLPAESHGQRNLVGYSPWVRRVGHD